MAPFINHTFCPNVILVLDLFSGAGCAAAARAPDRRACNLPVAIDRQTT
jgi:hypothetical protein